MNNFAPCEICGGTDWQVTYVGPIRDGAFGSRRDGAVVSRCGDCGADRLREDFCFDNAGYATRRYRRTVGQDADSVAYQTTHDPMQRFVLDALGPLSLRGKVVADVGCAGGSFLDHIAGIADRVVAIDPAEHYHADLAARGYPVYPSIAAARRATPASVDLAVSVQVIEHVTDPRGFLAEIAELVRPGGDIMVTTPNRADILMELASEDFPAFFYRTVHRWYFDADALAACGAAAGLRTTATRHIHRYPMANALHWLRDRRPRGETPMPALDRSADGFWRGYLESHGRADQLAMTFRRR